METSTGHLDRFLTSLHRRMVVVRMLERAGLCLLLACLTSIVLSPILIWRGESALGLISVSSAIGLLTGLVWGIAQRPRLLDVAMEADRQLELADLLSTVVSTRSDQSDLTTPGWRATLLALAEDRCRALAPSSVVLNRYGARTWGGIGLAAAMTLTLALVSTRPELIRAGDRPDRVSRVSTERSTEQNEPIIALGGSESRFPHAPDRRDPNDRNYDSTTDTPDDSTKQTQLSLDRGSSASGQDGAGTGVGRSQVETRTGPLETGPSPNTTSQSRNETGSGSGAASADPVYGSDEADSGTITSRTGERGRDPGEPRESSRGSISGESSRTAGVPDAYRDLIRDYFSDDR